MSAAIKTETITFSIVIPCYNESGRVEALLSGMENFERQFKYPFEIILVDDGCKDDTVAKVESSLYFKKLFAEKRFQIVRLSQNRGKGAALRAGVAIASNHYLLTMDADLSVAPQHLTNFCKHLAPNKILIASREHKGSTISVENHRKLAGRIFNFFVRTLTPLPHADTQCGFKVYPTAVAKKIFAQLLTEGWAHDVEILYRAYNMGVVIEDMPITAIAMEGSKINVIRDGIKMFIEIFRISAILHFKHLLVEPFNKENRKTDNLFRGVFAVSAIFLVALMAILSFDYGITGDDTDQKIYGEHVLSFYTSLGKDTSCLHLKIGNKENLHLYGGLFPMLSAALNKYIGGIDEYDMRHLLNSFAGSTAIIFCGLLAYSISGSWLCAFLAFLFLALWPQFFGHSMNNPKDIPFAMGYIITMYYLIQMVKQLPHPNKRVWVKLALAIAYTINIRVGGLILLGMLLAFYFGAIILSTEKRLAIKNNKTLTSNLKSITAVAVTAYFLGLVFWPYGLLGPIHNPMLALKESTNFSMPIGLFFEGKMMTSKDIPWYYILKWLWISTPVITLFSAMAFGAVWFLLRKKIPVERSLLLIFAGVFPWAYAVYSKSAMYDAMRQMLFLVPLLAVMASLTWYYIITLYANIKIKIAAIIILCLGLFPVIRFSFANHPNEYVYFNELVGGIQKAWLSYDTDYYMNSIKQTAKWFKQTDAFKQADAQHKIRLTTNTLDPVNHYFRNDTDKVKIIYTKWYAPGNEKSRANRDWDFGIYNSRTVEPSQLKYGIWPSDKAIFKCEADGVPLSVVIERKDKSDYYGYLAMKNDSTLLAEKYYTQAINYNKQNEEAYMNLLQIELNMKKYKEAATLAQQWHTVNPQNDFAYVYEGIALAYLGNFDASLNQLLYAVQINPDNYQAYNILASLYNQKGDKQNAQLYYNKAEEVKQKLQRE